ncbi:MAG: hypothetical protein ISR64_02650 [Deltaproteobacteria bacterium]|nr:hypothetical protein [Deltaproteobacteria bacterium]
MNRLIVVFLMCLLSVLFGCSPWGEREVRIVEGTSGAIRTVQEILTRADGLTPEVLTKKDITRGKKPDISIAFSYARDDLDVRTLVPLYTHYLFIVVHDSDQISSVPSLANHRIGTGKADSGTDGVMRALLRHYGLEAPMGQQEDDQFRCHAFSSAAGSICNGKFGVMKTKFHAGEIDALVVLGKEDAGTVQWALDIEGTRLLSLDEPEQIAPVMQGIRSSQPFVVSHIVPRHLFGSKPERPVGVIGSKALLVARTDLKESTAKAVTQAVFEYKNLVYIETGDGKGRQYHLREITDRFDRDDLQFPLHPGAEQYYQRDKPPFFVEYAEPISLGLALMAGAWSGLMALWARGRRKRRDQLGRFYSEFQKLVGLYDEKHETQLHEMSDDGLRKVHDDLMDLREKAFMAALAGQAEMNNSFTVFQDFVQFELEKIQEIQAKRQGTGDQEN